MVEVVQDAEIKLPERAAFAAAELKARRQARSRTIEYTKYTLPQYQVSWHHELIAELLDKVCVGEITRLMIFAPPRHGKSELVSIRMPARYLGENPTHSVIGTSYAQDLADTFSRATRNLISSATHQKLYPMKFLDEGERKWTLASKSANAAELTNGLVQAGDERPSYISAGAGGPITGQGCDLLNIDDPYKNYEEANSVINREKIWNWYSSTARTRLTPTGRIVITQTRWHDDDLVGRLIRLAKDNPKADQWVVLVLPGINDDGQEAKLYSTDGSVETKVFAPYAALWDRYNREYLDKLQSVQGPRMFAALYQQTPQPASGNIIKREWFHRWYVTKEWLARTGNKLPVDGSSLLPGYAFSTCEIMPEAKMFDSICQSWDLTFKDKATSDFVCGHVWGRRGAFKMLLDRLHERLDFPATKTAIRAWNSKWSSFKDHPKYIEDKANGPAILSDLKGEISGMIAVEPIGDKTMRLAAASSDCEAGDIILPWPGMYLEIYDFIECLCVFPAGVNDDDCDSFSQAMYKLKNSGHGLFELWKREAESLNAKPVISTGQQIVEHDKAQAFPTLTKQKKKIQTVFTTNCPVDGAVLSHYSEGRYKCNCCGHHGQDVVIQ